jgi:8-oxo-dGTP pyrophosphatase MutT (NUDIX family)
MIWDSLEEIPSDFAHPPLRASVDSLVRHFASDVGKACAPLRNPHHEDPVDEDQRRSARPAAVLIPIVTRPEQLSVLLTRRHREISHAGHICFPGGRRDPGDADIEETALREAQEEVGLDPARVRILGRLGDYVTQSGYRIGPVVGLVAPPLELAAREGEVEEILELPLPYLLRSDSYRLARRDPESGSAVFFLRHQGVIVTGPTVSLLMGLYEELLKTHDTGG